ncbi:MAG TPA: hypothetical protein DEO84_02115 [candidate division Zixibacteria bacterium]|nr:hypothetical protein [candidate division Zixibacteria bacterium]HBZ00092.1 hypothetical protein [candidate division Zixibacteria bacterium]
MKVANVCHELLGIIFPLLIILLWLMPNHGIAQSVETIVFDQFNDNAHGWVQIQEATINISDSCLHFDNHSEHLSSIWQIVEKIERGFFVSAITTHTGGVTDWGYGLSFGGRDYDNEYFFLISADGSFNVGKFEGGKWSDISEWTASDAVKVGSNAQNHLLVKAKSNWEFYINGVKVYSMLRAESFGGNAGVVVENEQAVDFDRFMLAEYKAGVSENEFCRKFGALVDDFDNKFANVIGDSVGADDSLFFVRNVKNPLPGFKDQMFMDYGKGLGFYGTYGSYESRSDAIDAMLRLCDLVNLTSTVCDLYDGGHDLENGVISGHTWLTLDQVSGTDGPFSNLVVGAVISAPSDLHNDWQVSLNILPLGDNK